MYSDTLCFRQLPAFARLGALRYLDLNLVGINQVLNTKKSVLQHYVNLLIFKQS